MAFGIGKRGGETNQLLQGLGLSARDVSPAALAVIQRLSAERDELQARLAAAEELADRDPLAPVFNRRAFLRELHRTMSEVERYKIPAAVIYVDLDGFKALNDRLGHSAGDAALHAVAERLVANVRESDVVGRMGGDEFAVVLMPADQAAAEARAGALAHAIEQDLHLPGAADARLRVSYGVREIGPEIDPESLIAQADAAMFDAKRQRKAG